MQPQLTIAEATRLFAQRKLSPVELAEDCFGRITQNDERINSFISLTYERAMADARASEQRWANGQALGKLDGIPIGHKDIYNTAGIRTTAHSRILEHNIPAEDGAVVRQLCDAGTVLMGKLAMHEFAMTGPSFDLPWPPARNPWNTDCFTAGSSSGTGAAVAAGFVLAGTGTDTSGSIRGPAALCGIAGLKPTYGLVSRCGILPLSSTLDHPGPMAWTVEDCALMLEAMAGQKQTDSTHVACGAPNFTAEIGESVKGLRVGVVRHFYEADNPISAAARDKIESCLLVMTELGAKITDLSLSPLNEYNACGNIILFTEAFAIHRPGFRDHFYSYGELFRDRIVLGALISGENYVQAQRRRRQLCIEMAEAMKDVDVLVTASQGGEAAPIDSVPKWATFEKPSFSIPFNVTGFPAISVCNGFGENGLPLAVQIVAKPHREALLLRVAHAYEQATSWRESRPDLSKGTVRHGLSSSAMM